MISASRWRFCQLKLKTRNGGCSSAWRPDSDCSQRLRGSSSVLPSSDAGAAMKGDCRLHLFTCCHCPCERCEQHPGDARTAMMCPSLANTLTIRCCVPSLVLRSHTSAGHRCSASRWPPSRQTQFIAYTWCLRASASSYFSVCLEEALSSMGGRAADHSKQVLADSESHLSATIIFPWLDLVRF